MLPNPPEFIEIATPDGLALPGLLYRATRSTTAVIYLHGNGSSSVFYNRHRNRTVASELAKKGISMLYFNNRGAHIMKRIAVHGKKKKWFGMAYEKIKECIHDIDGAVDFLKKRGYKTFILAGYSTGANKVCVYHFYKKQNPIAKYLILGGGDDVGIYYDYLGKKKFWELLAASRAKIRQKRGEELIQQHLFDPVFSYKGFYDIANPDGDYNVFPFLEVFRNIKISTKPLFRHYASLDKPTLVVYGRSDEYAWENVPRVIETLKQYQPSFEYRVIKNADHGFHGHEAELARTLASWLY